MMLVHRISTLFLFMHIQSIICGYFELVDEFKICLESHDTVHNVYEDPKFTDIFEEKLIVWQRNFADRQKFEDIITAQNHFRSIMTTTICPPENNIPNCVTNVESCCNTFVEEIFKLITILRENVVVNAKPKENFRQCLSNLNTIDRNFINVLNIKVFESSKNIFKKNFASISNNWTFYITTHCKYSEDAKQVFGSAMKKLICNLPQGPIKYDCDIFIQQCSDTFVTEARKAKSLNIAPNDPVERMKDCLINGQTGYGLYDFDTKNFNKALENNFIQWNYICEEDGVSEVKTVMEDYMKEQLCSKFSPLPKNYCEFDVKKCCTDFIECNDFNNFLDLINNNQD
ncbi:uncharacterized protein LOC126894788 isoform X2 [Daktulosphaira vitifoliae]|uniref:uncharacterized protein LOC126894788 isoform X2 n=1 Tax=Daktulosphaira vitifoliae TaxID=58002 RepID=UPI0021AAA19E|nr:uncharacterized protein LOC126894788 isoform X2 [Daktulosphaira vitifoliae]